jgi:hypothetical protein
MFCLQSRNAENEPRAHMISRSSSPPQELHQGGCQGKALKDTCQSWQSIHDIQVPDNRQKEQVVPWIFPEKMTFFRSVRSPSERICGRPHGSQLGYVPITGSFTQPRVGFPAANAPAIRNASGGCGGCRSGVAARQDESRGAFPDGELVEPALRQRRCPGLQLELRNNGQLRAA